MYVEEIPQKTLMMLSVFSFTVIPQLVPGQLFFFPDSGVGYYSRSGRVQFEVGYYATFTIFRDIIWLNKAYLLIKYCIFSSSLK